MVELPFPNDAVVHGLFTALGLIAALGVFLWEKRRLNLSDDRLWTIVGCALAFGALGGRVGTWLTSAAGDDPASLYEWWLGGNRSIVSGIIGAWAGVYIGKWITGYRWKTGDLFAPATAIAMGIARIGCFLTEYPGTPTGGGWGVTLPAGFASGAAAHVDQCPTCGHHPSLLYEAVFHLAAFGVLWRLRGRLPRPGDLFLLYVSAYALFRFVVEFVRGNQTFALGLSGPQLVCLLTLPLLAARMVRMWRESRAAREGVHA